MRKDLKKWYMDRRSKKINKTSKTPAQDRIRNLQQLAERIKDSINNKVDQVNENQRLISKRKIESPARQSTQIKRFKTAQPIVKPKSKCQNIEIPDIFPLKTPAQNRLRLLQQKLCEDDEIIQPKEQTDSFKNDEKTDITQVIKQGFGIGIDGNIHEDNLADEISDGATRTETNDSGIIHVIPDTNVFLRAIACIENLILKDTNRCIVVPLIVLQELDGLKRGDKQTGFLARRAIVFLYNQLKMSDQRFRGQKWIDDQQNVVTIKVDDDRILNCCVQLKQRNQNVILLTNDKNLINKARSYDVVAVTTEDYEKKIFLLNMT